MPTLSEDCVAGDVETVSETRCTHLRVYEDSLSRTENCRAGFQLASTIRCPIRWFTEWYICIAKLCKGC
jgi:hypothetical protein